MESLGSAHSISYSKHWDTCSLRASQRRGQRSWMLKNCTERWVKGVQWASWGCGMTSVEHIL